MAADSRRRGPNADAPARVARAASRLAMGAAVVIAALWACADFEAPEDTTFGIPDVAPANPSFARHVQPILTARCALGGCHTVGSHQAGLVLQAGRAYDELLDGYVVPGDSLASFVYRRIHPDPALRFNLPRMPLAATPLTRNQILTIGRWIQQGAQRN